MANRVYIERYIPAIKLARGTYTKLPINLIGTGANLIVGGTTTLTTVNVSGILTASQGGSKIKAPVFYATPVAINASATATAAQFASGYITSTSAAATSITTPTAAAITTQLNSGAGTIFNLTIDNTAGANTVTVVMDASIGASALATAFATEAGLLTFPSGATGQGTIQFMFSSTTAATYTRIA